jgi:hypothetical protein
VDQLSHEIQLVNVTTKTLLDFVKGAKKRIFIAKPGYTKEEITAVIGLVKTKGVECTVYIDPKETAIRYGFGDLDAIRLAKSELDLLNLQTIEGIRLSIVIVDDKALVYTPAALSWEEEPSLLSYPNGLMGGQKLVDKILSQFSGPDKAPLVPENISIFPTTTVAQVEKRYIKEILSQTVKALEENPPVNPSALRTVNIYRNIYKLVKHEMRGAQVRNKTLNLNSFNRLFPRPSGNLRRSWQVFTAEDIESISQFPEFVKDITHIIGNHCVDAGRYGYLMLLSKKKEFEKNIQEKETTFTNMLNSGAGSDTALERILRESKNKLALYLTEEVMTDLSCLDQLCKHNRLALKRLKDKDWFADDKKTIMAEVIEDFIDNKLRFPKAKDLIDSIDIKLDYYDVSDELLNDAEFKDILTKTKVDPRTYTKGFEENKGP